MTSVREEAKRWQFRLRSLLLSTTVLPIVIGLAGGAFGEILQRAFLFVTAIFLWMALLLVSAGGLMFAIANGAFYFGKFVNNCRIVADRSAIRTISRSSNEKSENSL